MDEKGNLVKIDRGREKQKKQERNGKWQRVNDNVYVGVNGEKKRKKRELGLGVNGGNFSLS